jgi:hypothetical protein
MAKLFVTGVIEWLLIQPSAVVSVESGEGVGVSGLDKPNFTVGRIGGGAVNWVQLKVTDVNPIGGIGKGFYHLAIEDEDSSWQPHSSDLVFTIEVNTARGKEPGDQGQAIAINKCCGDFGG